MSVEQLQQEVLALPPAEQQLFARWVKQLDLVPISPADALRDAGPCPIWSPYGCIDAGEALLAELKSESSNA